MAEQGFQVPAAFLRDVASMKTIVLGSSRTKGRAFRRRRGGAGGGGGSRLDTPVLLLDQDINIDPEATVKEGIEEDDPASTTTADNLPPLTDEQIGDGMTQVLQDPPDDNPATNVRTSLDREGFKRTPFQAKYYVQPRKTVITTGDVQDGSSTTVELDEGAFSEDDELNGKTIVVIDADDVRQTRIISDSVFSTLTVTVSEAFDTTPDNTYTYEVSKRDPGYEEDEDGNALEKQVLALTSVDIGEDPVTRVWRFATLKVFWIDKKPFTCGEFTRDDFPDLDENITLESLELPDGFLNKQYRGIPVPCKDAAGSDAWLLAAYMCWVLPPPSLDEFLEEE